MHISAEALIDFAKGYRSDTKLGTVLEREGVDDLSQLLKKKRG